MSEVIGTTAGQIWQFLKQNGPATANTIQKKINCDSAVTNQALGWLAREGKLRIDRSKKASMFDLSD